MRSPSSATIKSDYFLVQCGFFFYFSCPGNDFHDPTSAPSRNPTLQNLVENACPKALTGEKGLDKRGVDLILKVIIGAYTFLTDKGPPLVLPASSKAIPLQNKLAT